MAKDTIILGVVFLVAILVVGSFVYTQAPKFWEFINNRWSDWVDYSDQTNGDNATKQTVFNGGSGYVGATITYKDGSQKTFRMDDAFSLLPLYVYDAQGYVQNIRVELWVTATFEGKVTGWTVTGSLDVDTVTAQGDPYNPTWIHDEDLTTVGISNTGGEIASGESIWMWETTLSEAQLEQWYDAVYSDWEISTNLKLNANVNVEFRWTDGHIEDTSLNAETVHLLIWIKGDLPTQSRLQSASMTITPSYLYKS